MRAVLPAIARPRSVARLRERFTTPVTLVVAPAGFGKTTLLAQAIAAAPEGVGGAGGVDHWLTCRPEDGGVVAGRRAVPDGRDPARARRPTGGRRGRPGRRRRAGPGRPAAAVERYRRQLDEEPDDPGHWAGLAVAVALAARGPASPAGRVLGRRAEVVRAVAAQLAAAGVTVPDPEALAGWIGEGG